MAPLKRVLLHHVPFYRLGKKVMQTRHLPVNACVLPNGVEMRQFLWVWVSRIGFLSVFRDFVIFLDKMFCNMIDQS
jgi:hypothetical protein